MTVDSRYSDSSKLLIMSFFCILLFVTSAAYDYVLPTLLGRKSDKNMKRKVCLSMCLTTSSELKSAPQKLEIGR